MPRRMLRIAKAHTRRIGVALVGSIVLFAGVAMIALPGPATLTIPAGLAILALEFAWAQRLLDRITEGAAVGLERIRSRQASN